MYYWAFRLKWDQHIKVLSQYWKSTCSSVCKKMFHNTTGIIQHISRSQVCETGNKDDQSLITQATLTNRVAILEYLKSLITMPSQYCCNLSSKKYIKPVFKSKANVHQECKQMVCSEADNTIHHLGKSLLTSLALATTPLFSRKKTSVISVLFTLKVI